MNLITQYMMQLPLSSVYTCDCCPSKCMVHLKYWQLTCHGVVVCSCSHSLLRLHPETVDEGELARADLHLGPFTGICREMNFRP